MSIPFGGQDMLKNNVIRTAFVWPFSLKGTYFNGLDLYIRKIGVILKYYNCWTSICILRKLIIIAHKSHFVIKFKEI